MVTEIRVYALHRLIIIGAPLIGICMNYSTFMAGLKKAGIELNRKMLSEMPINDPKSFAALVETVKNA